MRSGHISLPNGLGIGTSDDGDTQQIGDAHNSGMPSEAGCTQLRDAQRGGMHTTPG